MTLKSTNYLHALLLANREACEKSYDDARKKTFDYASNTPSEEYDQEMYDHLRECEDDAFYTLKYVTDVLNEFEKEYKVGEYAEYAGV